MSNQSKVVYRDNESCRLITPREAKNRDPSTWTEEQLTVIDPRSLAPVTRDDLPIVNHANA